MTEIKRPIKKQPLIDEEACAGCSVCIENCPKDCIKLSEPKFKGDIRTVAVITNKNDCIGCGICSRVCPIEAITMIEEN